MSLIKKESLTLMSARIVISTAWLLLKDGLNIVVCFIANDITIRRGRRKRTFYYQFLTVMLRFPGEVGCGGLKEKPWLIERGTVDGCA